MGGVFGFSFGLLDVEDEGRADRRFDEDQAFNGAVGAVMGILMGAANQYLRDKAMAQGGGYSSLHVLVDDALL
eukprot:CAMPEP_0172202888 /NCGR_PEP_ID=MMETSP1050-20130122/30941_1 /TAXON_ID=233186 /ORGANISM="Cryptomonas curvata, Strain CCAP979/52" /LENGTH=72 /DNA_ID=CAMNT_0012880967 /DNA_START=447 /DNA_END=665 /DNA_ORIENTATION=+